MPLLDVSFVLNDPMLADCFNVRRRVSSVGPNGREVAAPDEVFNDQLGVVTQQDPSDLMRTEDGVMVPKRILICAQFQFIALAREGPSTLYQPDEVTWNGVVYTCVNSLPYSRYGAGFYEAIFEYRNAVPPLQ